ncbi:MAG: SCP2 sterol-binding domain-containing protein [Thermoplasmatales archaeon]|nr:SCP2 sterol-binding domain-containing protein [Thermoplasmatales archaeon]
MVGIINNKGDKGLKETLMNAIERFNEKCREDEKLRNELRDVVKKVNIEITDDKNYCFVLKNAMISGFDEGTVEKPDITIISNRETINGLMKKEISPFKAYATGKIKIKGSLIDLLKLKEFLN